MIDYDEGDWLFASLFRLKGSVVPRAMIFAAPPAIVTVLFVVLEGHYNMDSLRSSIGMEDVSGHSSQTWAASTAGILLLLTFRTNRAMTRFWEGTSLLHQMRGEWFDSVSCLITFSRAALTTKPDEVQEFRHTLVRLMSLCHGSALEEIKDNECDRFNVLDIRGLDRQTLLFLDECKWELGYDRVEVLLHMIQVLITQALDDGVIKVAPPILSRVYQTLSRGLVNLLNATKIKNTRFPYPYAQLISILLLLHMLWTPFMIAANLKVAWLAGIISFVPLFGMFCLNLIAIQLEMPFGNDDNDLPLTLFQSEMNRGLLMLMHPKADNLPHTSKACVKDPSLLQAHLGFISASDQQAPTLRKTNSMFQEAIESLTGDQPARDSSPRKSFFQRAQDALSNIQGSQNNFRSQNSELSITGTPSLSPAAAIPPDRLSWLMPSDAGSGSATASVALSMEQGPSDPDISKEPEAAPLTGFALPPILGNKAGRKDSGPTRTEPSVRFAGPEHHEAPQVPPARRTSRGGGGGGGGGDRRETIGGAPGELVEDLQQALRQWQMHSDAQLQAIEANTAALAQLATRLPQEFEVEPRSL